MCQHKPEPIKFELTYKSGRLRRSEMPKSAIAVDPMVKPDPSLEKRIRRVYTGDYKLSIIQQADACKHGELGALLRREKLYAGQLLQWRREMAEHGVILPFCKGVRSRSVMQPWPVSALV